MNRHVLSACEPQAVFRFFEDICAIPHPSGHEGAVADYVEEFAKARGLSYVRDAADNLLLRLPARQQAADMPCSLAKITWAKATPSLAITS